MDSLYKSNNFKGLKRPGVILLFVGFLFFVAGFRGSTAPLSPPVTQKAPSVEKKKANPVQVTEKVEQPDFRKGREYAYDPTGKPDPFRPFIQLTRDKKAKGALSPLQNYDLSQLKLVAIITIPKGNIGLVEDAAGKGYSLREGALIGRNNGKVKQILKDMVIVEEVYEDVLGQKKVNKISLFLHRSEKEGGNS